MSNHENVNSANADLVNLGNAHKDLAEEMKNFQEQKLTMPNGRTVHNNDSEPFYGILSSISEHHFLSNPIGALTVHITHVKHLEIDVIRRIFPIATLLDYYIRVDFLEKEYFSHLCLDIPISSNRVVFDHLITFSMDDVAANDGSETQNVTFSLIAVDEGDPQRHILVGRVEKPLLHFVHEVIASEVLLLSRPAHIKHSDGGTDGLRGMGTMLIKSAFAYGRFGYGYSNQIFDARMVPSDAVRHSLFPRYLPPPDRLQEMGQVLRFKPVQSLQVFPYVVPDVHIGNPALRVDKEGVDPESEAIRNAVPWLNLDLPFAPTLCKEKFQEWNDKFQSLKGFTTRRLAFLRQICRPEPMANVALYHYQDKNIPA